MRATGYAPSLTRGLGGQGSFLFYKPGVLFEKREIGGWECLWHSVTLQVSLSPQQVHSQPGMLSQTVAVQSVVVRAGGLLNVTLHQVHCALAGTRSPHTPLPSPRPQGETSRRVARLVRAR